MRWPAAEAAIQAHIEAQWAAGSYASVPLVFGNSDAQYGAEYVFVSIEGTDVAKTVYGGAGKRMSLESGIIYYHAFAEAGDAKTQVVALVDAMTEMLELQTISTSIKVEGANPPSPAESATGELFQQRQQISGSYYRCSGSAPFFVIDTR